MPTDYPKPADLTPDQQRLVSNVGYAINEWSNLEDSLMALFGTLLHRNHTIASAILSRLTSFSAKIDIIHAVAKVELQNKPELKYWNDLCEYVKELSGDRNNLAHSAVRGTQHGSTIGPSVTAHIAGTAKRTLDNTEIEELIQDFSECRWLAWAFYCHLSGTGMNDAKFHQPMKRRRPPRAQRLAGGPPKQKRPRLPSQP